MMHNQWFYMMCNQWLRLGVILPPSWGYFGVTLGLSWGYFGVCLGLFRGYHAQFCPFLRIFYAL